MKTPVIQAIMDPLRKIQATWFDNHKSAMADNLTRNCMLSRTPCGSKNLKERRRRGVPRLSAPQSWGPCLRQSV